MDAKNALEKLNGYNFQNRYLVGTFTLSPYHPIIIWTPLCSCILSLTYYAVLWHQPEKTLKSKDDLQARKDNLAQLKMKHGID